MSHDPHWIDADGVDPSALTHGELVARVGFLTACACREPLVFLGTAQEFAGLYRPLACVFHWLCPRCDLYYRVSVFEARAYPFSTAFRPRRRGV